MTQVLITLSLPGHDRTFFDARGVTHEALDTHHRIGIISLCGLLRNPVLIEDKTIGWLRAYASPSPPERVDCMACLVRRVRLDAMIDDARRETRVAYPMIELDVVVTP